MPKRVVTCEITQIYKKRERKKIKNLVRKMREDSFYPLNSSISINIPHNRLMKDTRFKFICKISPRKLQNKIFNRFLRGFYCYNFA